MWRGAYARFRGKFAFAKCFRERSCSQLLETRVTTSSWPHLPLHGNIFPFMATYSTSLAHLPLHWHIFPFIGTSSPSWHIFPFIGTSPLSWAHLPSWRGALAGHGLLPPELSRGFRRDTRGTLSEKCPVRFMPHLHTLSFRGGNLKD